MIAVVDSSVAVKWFVDEDGADLAAGLRRLPLIAPDLILAECANVFWKKVQRNEYAAADAVLAMRALENSGLSLVPAHGLAQRAIELSIALAHPAYDCFYLALAEGRGLPVVTADRRLKRVVSDRPNVVPVDVVDLAGWKAHLDVSNP